MHNLLFDVEKPFPRGVCCRPSEDRPDPVQTYPDNFAGYIVGHQELFAAPGFEVFGRQEFQMGNVVTVAPAQTQSGSMQSGQFVLAVERAGDGVIVGHRIPDGWLASSVDGILGSGGFLTGIGQEKLLEFVQVVVSATGNPPLAAGQFQQSQ